mgnify:CR=1 FL=1
MAEKRHTCPNCGLTWTMDGERPYTVLVTMPPPAMVVADIAPWGDEEKVYAEKVDLGWECKCGRVMQEGQFTWETPSKLSFRSR